MYYVVWPTVISVSIIVQCTLSCSVYEHTDGVEQKTGSEFQMGEVISVCAWNTRSLLVPGHAGVLPCMCSSQNAGGSGKKIRLCTIHMHGGDQEVARAFEVFQSYRHINFCDQTSSHTGGTGSRQGCHGIWGKDTLLREVELVEGLC